jgi:hypothetical protein
LQSNHDLLEMTAIRFEKECKRLNEELLQHSMRQFVQENDRRSESRPPILTDVTLDALKDYLSTTYNSILNSKLNPNTWQQQLSRHQHRIAELQSQVDDFKSREPALCEEEDRVKLEFQAIKWEDEQNELEENEWNLILDSYKHSLSSRNSSVSKPTSVDSKPSKLKAKSISNPLMPSSKQDLTFAPSIYLPSNVKISTPSSSLFIPRKPPTSILSSLSSKRPPQIVSRSSTAIIAPTKKLRQATLI